VTTKTNLMRQMSYDRLWKITDKLSDTYSKYYSQTEYVTGDEIIVLFKGRVIFK
jgi:hypothetical protein